MNPSEIHAIRLSLALTQEAFALAVGVRRATVSDWERGEKRPSRMAVIAIRRLLLAEPCK